MRNETLVEPKQGSEAPIGVAVGSDATPVARYLADMTSQLEAMARASKLELLAYLLAMARAEAETAADELASSKR